MDSIIKKYADNGEIDHLRYIFIDSLDVDPTFEKYRDEFAYCRNIPGLFEPYKELSPLKNDPSEWNDAYWLTIKKDQEDNYSLKRFEHMIEVAKVVYADKIERITLERKERKEEAERKQKEREEQLAKAAQKNKTVIVNQAPKTVKNEPKISTVKNTAASLENSYSQPTDNSAQLERMKKAEDRLDKIDKVIEEKNKKAESEYAKKAWGTAAIIAVIIIAAVILVIKFR